MPIIQEKGLFSCHFLKDFLVCEMRITDLWCAKILTEKLIVSLECMEGDITANEYKMLIM